MIIDTCLPCGETPSPHRPDFARINSTINRLKNRVDAELDRLASSYGFSDEYENRPSLEECCGYESISFRLNLDIPTDLNSLHRALSDVASLLNDAISLQTTSWNSGAIMDTINITLCQLHRYFMHTLPIGRTASFSSCRRSSSLVQCSCSQDCKAKIVIDYVYSASTLLAQVARGADRTKNNYCRAFRG
nr:hypothetical protein BgiMline_001900 [Biomphalaria glabrata]